MRRNILVIDDDKDIQELVTFILGQAGFAVRSTVDGVSALSEVRENHYDLLILDLSMPHMGGLSFLKTLRASVNLKHLPVIMLTGSGDVNDLNRVKPFDISDYVLKPPKKDDLLARVERVLGGRPQYEEIKFNANSASSMGCMQVPLRLISISNNGMVVSSTVAVEKGLLLSSISLNLFKKLNINQDKFIVSDCVVDETSTHYEYFLSFLGMTQSDQEKIRAYIMDQTFERKNKAL